MLSGQKPEQLVPSGPESPTPNLASSATSLTVSLAVVVVRLSILYLLTVSSQQV